MLCSALLSLSQSHSYTLGIGRHFEPAPSLHRKYYDFLIQQGASSNSANQSAADLHGSCKKCSCLCNWKWFQLSKQFTQNIQNNFSNSIACQRVQKMDEVTTECCVRVYHVYMKVWTALIEEELVCTRELATLQTDMLQQSLK